MIAICGVAAILRYNVEGALKILGVLSGVFGVLIGAFVTYFFTRIPIAEARQKAVVAETRAAEAESKLSAVSQQAATFAGRIASAPDQLNVGSLRRDPDFVKFFFKPYGFVNERGGSRIGAKLEEKPIEKPLEQK